MNLDKLKLDVSRYYNVYSKFIYKTGRGQDDIFFGKIVKFYPRIFIIKTDNDLIKSFSYSDYATNSLKIC